MPSPWPPLPRPIIAGLTMASLCRCCRFVLSPEGAFFREFLLDEAVKSVDALSRDQFRQLLTLLGMQNAMVPVLLPGAARCAAARPWWPAFRTEGTVQRRAACAGHSGGRSAQCFYERCSQAVYALGTLSGGGRPAGG